MFSLSWKRTHPEISNKKSAGVPSKTARVLAWGCPTPTPVFLEIQKPDRVCGDMCEATTMHRCYSPFASDVVAAASFPVGTSGSGPVVRASLILLGSMTSASDTSSVKRP